MASPFLLPALLVVTGLLLTLTPGLYTRVVWYQYGKKHFTKSGYESAKMAWEADILPTVDLTHKRIMVTGANSGIGKELALYFASRGAIVYMVCRNAERGVKAMEEIKAMSHSKTVHLIIGDCGVKTDIQHIAEEYKKREPHLDALVCNAGALLKDRTVTAEGHEVTFATHVLYGLYGLGTLLMPMLQKSPGQEGRLVAVSSGGMYQTSLDLKDLENMKYNGIEAYCKAKRAQVAIIEQWAAASKGVTFVSCHPGWASTPGVDASIPGFRDWVGHEFRTAWEGAQGIAWLSVTPKAELNTGAFYLDRVVAPKHLLGLRTQVSPAKGLVLMDKLKTIACL